MSSTHSKIAFYAIVIALATYTFAYYPRWQQQGTEATIGWDVAGYYFYLPATFIYKDIKHCAFGDSVVKKYQCTPDYQQTFKHNASGNVVIKYTMGQALAMLPGFLVGHLWAISSKAFLADGFSFPYQASVGISMFIYACLGLYYLRKVLLHYYTHAIAMVTLWLIAFGTNYLNYATVDQGMTHSTTFTILAMLLWQSIKFWKEPNKAAAVKIGALCGFAILVRPTDAVIILVPLLWSVSSMGELLLRWRWVKQNYVQILPGAVACISVAFLQLAYYKYITGEWLVYSYGDQGFDWLSPNTCKFMFSYKCGWFLYCPLMLLPFLGFGIFNKQSKNTFAVFATLATAIYIVTSWHIWDYGVTSGRAMIQYYPLLALPFAALLHWLATNKYRLAVGSTVITLFVYINIWWCYNAHRGNVRVIDLTQQYYWRMLGKWYAHEDDLKLLDTRYSFSGIIKNADTLLYRIFPTNDSSSQQFGIDSTHQYSPLLALAQNNKMKEWLRVQATLISPKVEHDWWQQPHYICRFTNQGKEVATHKLLIPRFLPDNIEKVLWLDSKPPRAWDSVHIYLWNAGSEKSVSATDVLITTFDE
jgi:hypothetical protein